MSEPTTPADELRRIARMDTPEEFLAALTEYVRAAPSPAPAYGRQAPEPSDNAVRAAAGRIWIEPGKLDLAATAEGLRAAYMVDFGGAASADDEATAMIQELQAAHQRQMAELVNRYELRGAAPASPAVREAAERVLAASDVGDWQEGADGGSVWALSSAEYLAWEAATEALRAALAPAEQEAAE